MHLSFTKLDHSELFRGLFPVRLMFEHMVTMINKQRGLGMVVIEVSDLTP